MNLMTSSNARCVVAVGVAIVFGGCRGAETSKPVAVEPPPATPKVAAPSGGSLRSATPEEAKRLLDSRESYVYVDVRTVEEFTEGHVPGALNIPAFTKPAGGEMVANDAFLSVLQSQVPKDAKVIVGCRSGGRSARAQKMMAEAGYKNVTNMDGGFVGKTDAAGNVTMPGWSKLGYPTEVGDGGAKSYARLKATP